MPSMPRGASITCMTQVPNYLDTHGVADYLGLEYNTVRSYYMKAKQRVREGRSESRDFPMPDKHFGASPVWAQSTVDEWNAVRRVRSW